VVVAVIVIGAVLVSLVHRSLPLCPARPQDWKSRE
jgi:hypothetical protein